MTRYILIIAFYLPFMAYADVGVTVTQPSGELKSFDKEAKKIKIGPYDCEGDFKIDEHGEFYTIVCNFKDVSILTSQLCSETTSPFEKGFQSHDVVVVLTSKPHSKDFKQWTVKLHCK
jgi:hypothetical protein